MSSNKPPKSTEKKTAGVPSPERSHSKTKPTLKLKSSKETKSSKENKSLNESKSSKETKSSKELKSLKNIDSSSISSTSTTATNKSTKTATTKLIKERPSLKLVSSSLTRSAVKDPLEFKKSALTILTKEQPSIKLKSSSTSSAVKDKLKSKKTYLTNLEKEKPTIKLKSSSSTSSVVKDKQANCSSKEAPLTTITKPQTRLTLLKNNSNKKGTKSQIVNLSSKSSNAVPSKINLQSTKRVPVRAVHEPNVAVALLSQTNVMNTIHNVTVQSPPAIRKQIYPQEDAQPPEEKAEPPPKHVRARTVTLEPDEVLVLNKSKAPEPTVETIPITPVSMQPVHEAVTFTVEFDQKTTTKQRLAEPKPSESFEPDSSESESSPRESDDEYEDDFDSYESDFESYSNTSSAENTDAEESQPKSVVGPTAPKTQPIDGLDSGLYDLKVHSTEKKANWETTEFEAQIDSGFGQSTVSPTPKTSGNQPTARRKISKRAQDLMDKITLDIMSFGLFELKPMPYEHYMKIYGYVKSSQKSVQTTEIAIDQEVQTIGCNYASVWTQFPPNFNADRTLQPDYYQHRIGCGRDESDVIQQNDSVIDDPLEQSLAFIRKEHELRRHFSTQPTTALATAPIDNNRLSWFLQKSSITVASIVGNGSSSGPVEETQIPGSLGYFSIKFRDVERLKATSIRRLFASNGGQTHCVYVVHDNDENKAGEFASVISMWNLSDAGRPTALLSCWADVNCVTVDESQTNVVFAGLNDGTMAVWNLLEPRLWLPDRQECALLAPSHLVEPVVAHKETAVGFVDWGKVMAVRIICAKENISPQVCSLHENGILTTWSLLRSTTDNMPADPSPDRIDHRSPWSTVRLVQTHCIDLAALWTTFVRPKTPPTQRTTFTRTHSYFESNIFSDAVLQDLQAIDGESSERKRDTRIGIRQPLRCEDVELIGDLYFVTTNKPYLLTGSRSLVGGRMRTIRLSDDVFVHGTKIRAMVADDRKALLVGLSDGSVQLLRSNPRLSADCTERVVGGTSNADAFDDRTAKSCAIQNIIKDERREIEHLPVATTSDLDSRSIPATADETEWQFHYSQPLLHGLSLRHHRVNWLDYSMELNQVICLCRRTLRRIDMDQMIEKEEENEEDQKISIAVFVKSTSKSIPMVLLVDGELQVHTMHNK